MKKDVKYFQIRKSPVPHFSVAITNFSVSPKILSEKEVEKLYKKA